MTTDETREQRIALVVHRWLGRNATAAGGRRVTVDLASVPALVESLVDAREPSSDRGKFEMRF